MNFPRIPVSFDRPVEVVRPEDLMTLKKSLRDFHYRFAPGAGFWEITVPNSTVWYLHRMMVSIGVEDAAGVRAFILQHRRGDNILYQTVFPVFGQLTQLVYVSLDPYSPNWDTGTVRDYALNYWLYGTRYFPAGPYDSGDVLRLWNNTDRSDTAVIDLAVKEITQ